MELIVGSNKFLCNSISIDQYSIFCDDIIFKKDKVDIIKSESPLMESKMLPFSFRSRHLIHPGDSVEVILQETVVSGIYRASVFIDETKYSISYMIVENKVKNYINTKSIVGIKARWK